MVRSVMKKEFIMSVLEKGDAFTLTYRLLFKGVPTYVHLKATLLEDEQGRHIVLGVSNIDAQMRREREQASALRMAREMVNRDALTGVKSKHAYVEEEGRINAAIARGQFDPFAIAVCDVNGLKEINDSHGHAAGDELICRASSEICNIFDHSPVFRYGGDEFVVILRGRDYNNRAALLQMLEAINRDEEKNRGAVIACGLAEFRPGEDASVAAVFERADGAMYENKKQLKSE